MKNQLGKKSNEKKVKVKKDSFWGFLCPCLCVKSSKSEKSKFERESQGRAEFQQENTENLSDVHQQTQSNLPVNFKVTQFDIHKPQVVRLQREEDNDNNNQKLKTKQQKLIKFNVKRNNNMGGYLFDNKATLSRPQGKQNNHPSLNSNENQPNTDNNQPSIPQKQKRFTSPKNTEKLSALNGRERIIQRLNNNHYKKDRQQLIGIQKRLQNMQGLGDYQFLQNWQQTYENHYPINKLTLGKLMVLGDNKNKLLCKVSSVKLFPSPSSLERYKQSIRAKKLNLKYGNKDVEFNSELDRYWDKRYFLFEKFDQGIKLDEQSWYSVTPEAVADYISTKINVKQTILDAFCGAGGDAIKLAAICKRVIANDIDNAKIACLINNAKIYDVNNLTVSCEDFFNFNQKVDAVYLAPPWGGPDYFKIESFHPQQFEPKLSLILQKALTLSSNIFFLLPANTDVQCLAALMSQKVRAQKNFIAQTCVLKIQKIYYNQRLKFILGFYGNSQVQNEIKLTDELKYIYEMLRDSDEGIFKHKKLIRKIRQQYGMVNLLNWVFQCDSQYQPKFTQTQLSMVDKFQKFLLQKRLIDSKTLQKIKAQQQAEYEYEVKNRENKSKKQKNKKIQKHKDKQMRQSSLYQTHQQEGVNKQQCPQQDMQIQQGFEDNFKTSQPIVQRLSLNNNLKQLNCTVKSRISSEGNIEQSQQHQGPAARDSMRTVSMASEFHQDQLHNITYDRMTTQSDVSITDSIYHYKQKSDNLDISVDQSYRMGTKEQEKNQSKFYFSGQKPSLKDDNFIDKKQRMLRFSSPAVLSPRQNFKMKKVKGNAPTWEKGIVEELSDDNAN